jgi:Flp pilus assembly protein TadG
MLKNGDKFPAGRRGRVGAATVEFALTVPVLVLVTFGLIEIGQAVLAKQLLVNAARDGARSATLEGANEELIRSSVKDFLEGANITDATVHLSPQPLTLAQGGDPVTVTVSVPFSGISWLPAPMFMKSIQLSASVVMRREVFTSTP